ncbi:pirin family protein [Pelagibius litoralis]|uniref:Pirin family protein n=1 Tax=Pelagibius litoralis TaxID=374515 RepID=A0A967EYA2_9PROT|nr:pirin family protein [Pelagibius litoralis]NIA69594.1 pirin family protein [Pelagibius litoralis]
MSEPSRAAGNDPVELTIEPRSRDLGGFSVRRILPYAKRRLVGPFIFLDEMGPADFPAGEGIDVRPHPHIGLATVTYLFDGEIMHHDSLGYAQAIRPGAVNWMTAGRGIVHSERTGEEARAGAQRLHGMQSWIALPVEDEEAEPGFTHYPTAALPEIQRPGVWMRLIAGSAYGRTSPVKVFSEMFYLHAEVAEGAELALPDSYAERAVYVVNGSVEIAGQRYEANTMAVFKPGVPVEMTATASSRVMLLGGATLPGERAIWWNFVSSSPERMERAKADWKAGRFARVPGDDEFIPLPED